MQPHANQEDTCSHGGCCCFYCKCNSGSVMIMRGSGGLPALVFVAVKGLSELQLCCTTDKSYVRLG